MMLREKSVLKAPPSTSSLATSKSGNNRWKTCDGPATTLFRSATKAARRTRPVKPWRLQNRRKVEPSRNGNETSKSGDAPSKPRGERLARHQPIVFNMRHRRQPPPHLFHRLLTIPSLDWRVCRYRRHSVIPQQMTSLLVWSGTCNDDELHGFNGLCVHIFIAPTCNHILLSYRNYTEYRCMSCIVSPSPSTRCMGRLKPT